MTKSKLDKRAACPNNSRHGELIPHRLGGLVCVECQAEHKPRSKTAYRFADPTGHGFVIDSVIQEK